MKNTSISEFETELSSMYMAFGRNAPDLQLVKVWHQRLSDYSFPAVRDALYSASSVASGDSHPPSLPQVLAMIPGASARIDERYLLGQLLCPTCSAGVLFKVAVGTSNIRMMGDPSYDRIIKAEATKFLNQLPDMTKRFVTADGYSPKAITVLMREEYRHIDMQEFAGHRIPPEIAEKNRRLCHEIKAKPQLLANTSEPMDKKAVMHADVKSIYKEMMDGLGGPTEKEPALEREPCSHCSTVFEAILTICPKCEGKRNG